MGLLSYFTAHKPEYMGLQVVNAHHIIAIPNNNSPSLASEWLSPNMPHPHRALDTTCALGQIYT